MARMILLYDKNDNIVPYDPVIHRAQVVSQLVESDLWPDLADCQSRADEIFTQYADYSEEDFLELPDEEMRRYAFAQTQRAEVNIQKLANERLEQLITDGAIYFGTEQDRIAQTVPEPEDYNDLPIADTRHPLNTIKVEIK